MVNEWKPEKNISSPWDVDVREINVGQPVKPSGDNLPYPYSVKKEAIDEYRMDTIEERLTRIEDKVDLLITQLKIEFYKK